jgi:putative ABC transport system permease protein
MAVVAHEFGQVARFPKGLLPAHHHAYLNLLSLHPTAALVSQSFSEQFGVKPGDRIFVNWSRQDYLPLTVYGFIDYWPTYNPFGSTDSLGPHLVVGNLEHTHAKMALEPYDVWLRIGPRATSSRIYEQMVEAGLLIESLEDAGQQLIRRKNDPLLQGTNGALTLGFLVTMAVSVMGLLIFWVLSIRDRLLQFGVFRAMGMGLRQIVVMLVLEQTLITGFALPAGAAVGALSGRLFVPLLQIVYSAAEQVPPFRVVTQSTDYLRVYLTVAGLVVATSLVMAIRLSRLRVHQAVKLGEE